MSCPLLFGAALICFHVQEVVSGVLAAVATLIFSGLVANLVVVQVSRLRQDKSHEASTSMP